MNRVENIEEIEIAPFAFICVYTLTAAEESLTHLQVEYSGAEVECRPLVSKVPGSSPLMNGS